MVNEIAWQRRILNQVAKEGGYGKKWATPYTVGVPDLVLSLPRVGLTLAEVKLETNWAKNTQRTIGLTEKQSLELSRFYTAGARTRVLLVVDNGEKDVFMNIFSPPEPRSVLKLSLTEARDRGFVWEYRGQRRGFVDWLSSK